jgi:hypothetical protein
MTREELLNKEIIRVKDIMSAYDCNYNKATQIIRAIKAFNDRYCVRGCVHVLDYIDYWNSKSKGGVYELKTNANQ